MALIRGDAPGCDTTRRTEVRARRVASQGASPASRSNDSVILPLGASPRLSAEEDAEQFARDLDQRVQERYRVAEGATACEGVAIDPCYADGRVETVWLRVLGGDWCCAVLCPACVAELVERGYEVMPFAPFDGGAA